MFGGAPHTNQMQTLWIIRTHPDLNIFKHSFGLICWSDKVELGVDAENWRLDINVVGILPPVVRRPWDSAVLPWQRRWSSHPTRCCPGGYPPISLVWVTWQSHSKVQTKGYQRCVLRNAHTIKNEKWSILRWLYCCQADSVVAVTREVLRRAMSSAC